ncbi:MAG TPA: hypothetical protein VGJ84_02410 [Polyangiaceae bacterium]
MRAGSLCVLLGAGVTAIGCGGDDNGGGGGSGNPALDGCNTEM